MYHWEYWFFQKLLTNGTQQNASNMSLQYHGTYRRLCFWAILIANKIWRHTVYRFGANFTKVCLEVASFKQLQYDVIRSSIKTNSDQLYDVRMIKFAGREQQNSPFMLFTELQEKKKCNAIVYRQIFIKAFNMQMFQFLPLRSRQIFVRKSYWAVGEEKAVRNMVTISAFQTLLTSLYFSSASKNWVKITKNSLFFCTTTTILCGWIVKECRKSVLASFLQSEGKRGWYIGYPIKMYS